MAHTQKTLPIDAHSAATLAADNLRLDLVDTDDTTVYHDWLNSTMRGFHGGQQPDDELAASAQALAYRRTTGVWDPSIAEPGIPVATADSFESPLTVPGGRDLPAWAISMVSVAPSHRRRGIARELLQSELRAAVALGIPMAMLTVSESTIYHRFGFAPAAMAADVTIDTRRARYIGPVPGGRVQLVSIESARAAVDGLYEKARLTSPGEMEVWPRRWDQIFGVPEEQKDVSKKPRAVRYDDENGVLQGIAVYRMKEEGHDFAGHVATVEYFTAATPDAYAALWRFLLELDLTKSVTASLRPVDEPVRWLINDFRAMKVETYDHLWLRILDVPAALNARQYYGPLDLTIEVTDQQGHAAGTYHLGSRVEPVETTSSDLTLSINELSALYLGGVSAVALQTAGRIHEHTPGAVHQLDTAFRSPVTPWLSVWF